MITLEETVKAVRFYLACVDVAEMKGIKPHGLNFQGKEGARQFLKDYDAGFLTEYDKAMKP